MVDEERLKKWVENKLDEGVEPERIKKTLKNTDRDPSVVDDVLDPFQDQEERPDPEPIEPSENDDSSDEESSNEINDSEKEDDSSQTDERRQKFRERGRESREAEEGDDSGFSLPSFSTPSFERPSLNVNISRKAVAAVVLILIAVSGVVYASGAVNALDIDNNSEETRPVETGSCPDVGVRIRSVSVEEGALFGGSTHAELRVNRGEAEVAIDLRRSGEIIDTKVMTFEGDSEVSFNSVGDEVVMFPTGCPRQYDSRTVS